MAKDTPETAFTKAQAAQALIDTLTADIKKKQAERKVAQADLKAHRKAVLDALGRKPRGPRKPKVEKCEHGTKLPNYCQMCQDQTQEPNQ